MLKFPHGIRLCIGWENHMFLWPSMQSASTRSMEPDKLFWILISGFRQTEQNAKSDIKQDSKTKYVFWLQIDWALSSVSSNSSSFDSSESGDHSLSSLWLDVSLSAFSIGESPCRVCGDNSWVSDCKLWVDHSRALISTSTALSKVLTTISV